MSDEIPAPLQRLAELHPERVAKILLRRAEVKKEEDRKLAELNAKALAEAAKEE